MRKIIEIPVGDLMSAPALTVKPETTIDELTQLFAEHEFNGLPVVDDANCVGDELKATVNAQLGQDVLDMVADRGRADVEALRDRPAGGASGEEVDNLRLASRERMEAGLGQG
jgi:CBS-domain-containing membrane protein